MSPRDWKYRLDDILTAIDDIERFIGKQSKDEFNRDKRTFYAVIRALEIIGEAAKSIPKEVKENNPSIPWQLMADMRNRLAHEYFGVDSDIIWQTATKSLPALKKELKKVK